jgi:hypothetical protein
MQQKYMHVIIESREHTINIQGRAISEAQL